MKFRLATKQIAKNIPSARPRIKVNLRAFDAQQKKVERQLTGVAIPIASPPKSLDLKKPDGRVNNGKHMKGFAESNPDEMKRRRAMRKFFGRHMPVPQCSTCAFSTNCPQFKADYECAFLPFLNSHRVETPEDLMEAMENALEANTQRLHLSTIFERLSGAAPSAELSESYAMLFQQMQQLFELKKNGTLRPPEQKNSTIVQLFGNINMLVDSTASHHKAIEEAPQDVIPTETNAQLALTEGDKKDFVPAELLEDMSGSRPDSVDMPTRKKPTTKAMPSVAQATLK